MSYESKLVFVDANAARKFLESIALNAKFATSDERHINLKYPNLQSLSIYDIRLTLETPQSIWIEVNFSSKKILEIIEDAISSLEYQCFEDGDIFDPVDIRRALHLL